MFKNISEVRFNLKLTNLWLLFSKFREKRKRTKTGGGGGLGVWWRQRKKERGNKLLTKIWGREALPSRTMWLSLTSIQSDQAPTRSFLGHLVKGGHEELEMRKRGPIRETGIGQSQRMRGEKKAKRWFNDKLHKSWKYRKNSCRSLRNMEGDVLIPETVGSGGQGRGRPHIWKLPFHCQSSFLNFFVLID